MKVETCHNITSATAKSATATLDYSEAEAKTVAVLLTHLKYQSHGQQFMLSRGLKEFPLQGVDAAKEELQQMHSRSCFKAIAVNELTRQERVRAQ